jgi:simple sugar transport system permease protein
MIAAVLTAARRADQTLQSRSWLTGVIMLVLGAVIAYFFGLGSHAESVSTFRLTDRTDAIQLPNIVLPTQTTNYLLGGIVFLLGLWQLVRGFRRANLVLGANILILVLAFFIWAARDTSLSLTGLLQSTLLRATPILLGAMCGLMCERAGVVNIAIEGMMLCAAMTSVIVANAANSIWVGLGAAFLTSLTLAAVHAVFAITFRVDQIISGTVINIFSVGITNYVNLKYLQTHMELNNERTFDVIKIPFLSDIPVLGPVFFNTNLVVYTALALMFVLHFVLFYTPWGLRTRAVGEHPLAADTLGINVFKMRYINVLLGGLIAGLGGAFFTLGSVGRFDKLMTGGRGFIGLAAMIFGNWTPFGAFASSLIFGFADSLQVKLQIVSTQVGIPSEFYLMAPYIATIIVLVGVVGRAIPPKADGVPYEKQ